jgi:hypothetical protein
MRRPLLLALTVVLVSAPAAAAAEPIEGTWSFQSGEVLVKANGPGTFAGTVVKDTQFNRCPHKAGEQMWTISGSGTEYTGGHNWFNQTNCTFMTPQGQSTWRITAADATRYELEFCTAQPGSGPAGPENATTRCHVLRRLRPPEPPVTPAVQQQVLRELPATKRCQSRRVFRIRVRQIPGVAYRSVAVTVNGRAARVSRAGGRHVAQVDLRRLPRGRFTVRIAVLTAEGQPIRATRRYRTCTPKRRGAARGRL